MITRKFGWVTSILRILLDGNPRYPWLTLNPTTNLPFQLPMPEIPENGQTHARNKTSFRAIRDDGTVSHLTCHPTFLESTRINKSNFNMFLSFTTFTHLHEMILVKKHKSKELLEKPNQNQRFFSTQPPRALIFTGFRTSAASLFKASPNLSASFWEVGSQDTWTQVGWLQLSWRWRWRWLLHLRVVSPFFFGKDCE